MIKKMLIEKVPLDLVVVIFCLLAAINHANEQEYVKPISGVLSVLTGLLMGYLTAWMLVAQERLALHNAVIVALSAILSYSSTGVLVAISTVGRKIFSRPNALLKAALPGFLADLIPNDEPEVPAQKSSNPQNDVP
jgi:hypothetical protein